MERSALLTAYDAACRKAAANAWVIGQDPREFPGRMDGDYFAPARDSLRSVEHIFCWTPSFFTGMALLAAEHTGDFSLARLGESLYEPYRAKVFDTPEDTMHDLGFMYTLYSTMAYRLTGNERMRALSVRRPRCWHTALCRTADISGHGAEWMTASPTTSTTSCAGTTSLPNSRGLAIYRLHDEHSAAVLGRKGNGRPLLHRCRHRHADTTLH